MQQIPRHRRRQVHRVVALAALIAPVVALGAVSTPVSAGIITTHAVINEIVANPSTGSAWVEIYNPTSGTASICELRDDDGNQTSGCGNMVTDFMVRVIDPDFLDDGGDTITLRGTTGDLDTVTYPALGVDQSYARVFDGGTEWEVRSDSRVTRNASNGAVPEDVTAPVLHVSAPVSGATYRGGFTASYSASDPIAGVSRVVFYLRDGASSGAYEWHGTDLNTANQEPFNSIEEFHLLAPGTYDLCVTALDKLGNGEPSLASTLAACDGTSTALVAIDDVVVTESEPPPADPVVALSAPTDGSVTADGTPTLSWTTTVDPSYLVISTTLTLSRSADFTATPVAYTPTGDSFTLPDTFAAAADATWFWKVVLSYARTPTSSTETVASAVWSLTIDRDELPARRFELNGVDFSTYAYADPSDATVNALAACVLTLETFNIGADEATIDIISLGAEASVPLVDNQLITSNHLTDGSNGTWIFDIADHGDTAIAGGDGYVLLVAIFSDGRRTMEAVSRFSLPLSCLEDDPPPAVTVTFRANGGTGTMTPQTATEPTALTANEFVRGGHRFAGWNTAADGSGTAYGPGEVYSFAASLTLFAQWVTDPVSTPPPTVNPIGQLPETGAPNPGILAIALLLIVGGAALLLVARRRTFSRTARLARRVPAE